MHRYHTVFFIFLSIMGCFAAPVFAQVRFEEGDYSLFTEAWVNNTLGVNSSGEKRSDGARRYLSTDAALRARGNYQLAPDLGIGARVLVASDTDDSFRLSDITALTIGKWGRVEIGRRQGLPDVLGGYAPNPYSYTSAEFGPASGRSLDPDGGLASSFFRTDLRNQVERISYLGNSVALAGDRSVKGLYVSPRLGGFIFGVAYTPDASTTPTGRGNDFSDLLQTGVSYEMYDGQETYRIGGSYTYAKGDSRVRDLSSFNIGTSVSLDDRFQPGSTTILGVNVSSDLDTGIVRGSNTSTAIGITTSANYEIGPWIWGGYYQFARAEGNVELPENDELQVLQLGSSYRFTTHLRVFNAAYIYDFDNENGDAFTTDSNGAIFLLGLRVTL